MEKREILYRRKDDGGSVTIDAAIDAGGTLRLGRFDHGHAVRELWGGDYERDLHVQPEHLPAVCLALIRQLYAGDESALSRFEALLADHAIPATNSVW